jgi:hypothetical protein
MEKPEEYTALVSSRCRWGKMLKQILKLKLEERELD